MLTVSLRLSVVSAVISVLGFGCQMLTARTFGARHDFDIYLSAISIPFLISGAAAGAVSQAFVPKLVSVRKDSATYGDMVRAMLLFGLVGGVVIASAGFALTVWSSVELGTAFTADDQREIIRIARVAWLSAGLALLGSTLTAVHHSRRTFVLPALTGSGAYLGMIAAVLSQRSSARPILLAWGMLAGSACSVLVLLPAVLRRIPEPGVGRIKLLSLFDGTSRVILVVLANCAFTGLAPVEAILAPRFGTGALSFLGYSQRLIIALGGVVVAGPNVLLAPSVAEASVANDPQRVKRLAARTIRAVVLTAALAAMVVYVLRLPLIELLLERGAFDAAMTRGVAGTLPWMLLGSIAMLGAQPAFRVLYGQNRHSFPAVVGVVVPALYFFLGSALSSLVGFQGIPIAYAVSWWAVFLGLMVRLFVCEPNARVIVPIQHHR